MVGVAGCDLERDVETRLDQAGDKVEISRISDTKPL